MTIEAHLERNGRVLLCTYSDPMDMGEVADYFAEHHQIFDDATQKIYIVADFTRVTRLPSNVLSSARGMTRKQHPNAGPVVIVADNLFMNMMTDTLSKLTKIVHSARTMHAALSLVDAMIAKETPAAATE